MKMAAWRGLCCHCNEGTETQALCWPPGVHAAWSSQPGSISPQVFSPRTLERDPGVTVCVHSHPPWKAPLFTEVQSTWGPWCPPACLPPTRGPGASQMSVPDVESARRSRNEAVWSLLQTTHHPGSATVDPYCPAQSKPTSLVWKLRFRSLHGQVLGKVPAQEGTLY